MTAFSTDTRSSMDACPPLEEIAAFLDGKLSPEDRERITAHLASCESCYEVFAAAIQFQEDEASEVGTEEGAAPGPFGSKSDKPGLALHPMRGAAPSSFACETDIAGDSLPPVAAPEMRPHSLRWLALAASVLLVTALGFFTWKVFAAPPQVILSRVVEQVEGEMTAEHVYLGEILRSEESPEYLLADRPAFLTGVHLLDLRSILQAGGDTVKTDQILLKLGNALQEVPSMSDIGKSYHQSRKGQLDHNALLRQEKEVQQFLSDSPHFQFGLWSEAGRLAALTESPEFFNDRNNRRFLDHLFEETPWAGDEVLEDVPTDLHEIQRIWNAGKPTREDYQALATHFENIIRAYDTSDEL